MLEAQAHLGFGPRSTPPNGAQCHSGGTPRVHRGPSLASGTWALQGTGPTVAQCQSGGTPWVHRGSGAWATLATVAQRQSGGSPSVHRGASGGGGTGSSLAGAEERHTGGAPQSDPPHVLRRSGRGSAPSSSTDRRRGTRASSRASASSSRSSASTGSRSDSSSSTSRSTTNSSSTSTSTSSSSSSSSSTSSTSTSSTSSTSTSSTSTSSTSTSTSTSSTSTSSSSSSSSSSRSNSRSSNGTRGSASSRRPSTRSEATRRRGGAGRGSGRGAEVKAADRQGRAAGSFREGPGGGTSRFLRLSGVEVPWESDPGKDEVGPHEALLGAVAGKLKCGGTSLGLSDVRVLRKSFDARKEPVFVYTVDILRETLVRALRAQGVPPLKVKDVLRKLKPVDDQLTSTVNTNSNTDSAIHSALPGDRSSRGSPEASPLDSDSMSGHEAAEASGTAREAAPAGRGPGGNGRQGRHSRGRSGGVTVVVGSGPAGLFAALGLAEAGERVVLLERGQPVEVRGRDIGAFAHRRVLDPESNFCYGEGGAGTWSDGKLTTRIGRNAGDALQVMRTLVALGAPERILVDGKPHLGTDRLVHILRRFRAHLLALGVHIRFGTAMHDLVTDPVTGAVSGVVLKSHSQSQSQVPTQPRAGPGSSGPQVSDCEREVLFADRVVLAVGHSARDVFETLVHHGVAMEPKDFAVGLRVEHPQSLINELQYGHALGPDAMEAAVGRGKGRVPVADYSLAEEVHVGWQGTHELGPAWQDLMPAGAASPIAGGTPPVHRREEAGRVAARGGAGEQGPGPGGLSGAGAEAGAAGRGGEGRRVGGSEAGAGGGGHAGARRGCYSFCMCPGGQVVSTSTSEWELCVNGMSFSRRSSRWANSALVTTVSAPDFAPFHHWGPLAGVAFQRAVERDAALRGGGNFVVPVQRVTDFLEGRDSEGPLPSSSYRLGVRAARLDQLYPPEVTRALQMALLAFDRKMPGFVCDQGLLHGAETRTSSPLRMHRDPLTFESLSHKGLYPIGEGAGYAGGIVSAAADGIRAARAILQHIGAQQTVASP